MLPTRTFIDVLWLIYDSSCGAPDWVRVRLLPCFPTQPGPALLCLRKEQKQGLVAKKAKLDKVQRKVRKQQALWLVFGRSGGQWGGGSFRADRLR